MSILGLGSVLFGGNDAIITYLKGKETIIDQNVIKEVQELHNNYNTAHTGKKLLASARECPNCSMPGNPQSMSWEVRQDVVDGYCWRCPVTTCQKCVGICKLTFFQRTRITLQKLLILIYWWVREYAVTDAMEEAEVSKHVAIDVYQCLWEVLLHKANIYYTGFYSRNKAHC